MIEHPFIKNSFLLNEVIYNIQNEKNHWAFYDVKPSCIYKEITFNLKKDDEIFYCLLICTDIIDIICKPKLSFFKYGFARDGKFFLNMDNTFIRKILKDYYKIVKDIISINIDQDDECELEFYSEHLLNQYTKYRYLIKNNRVKANL